MNHTPTRKHTLLKDMRPRVRGVNRELIVLQQGNPCDNKKLPSAALLNCLLFIESDTIVTTQVETVGKF